jgi:ribosomal protein S3AE
MLFEVLIAFEVLVPFWLEELETEMDSIFPLKKVCRRKMISSEVLHINAHAQVYNCEVL